MTVHVPDTLTIDYSEKYIMSIRLRPGGLSFSGYAPSEAESFFYREVEFDRAVPFLSSLQEFFFANECLSWAYKRVHVVSVSAGYTIVPRAFFREEEKGRLLDFNFAVPSPFCRSQSLAGEEAELVYPMDEDVYKFCSRSLSRPFFSSSAFQAVRAMFFEWFIVSPPLSLNSLYNTYTSAPWRDLPATPWSSDRRGSL